MQSFLACPAGRRSTREGCAASSCRPSVRRIIIAADNDESGVGQRNALAAYDRWTAEGRSVRIVAPPVVGDDFNDVLLKEPVDVER